LSPTLSEEQNRGSSISKPNQESDLEEIGTTKTPTPTPIPHYSSSNIYTYPTSGGGAASVPALETTTPTPTLTPIPTPTPTPTPDITASVSPTPPPDITPEPSGTPEPDETIIASNIDHMVIGEIQVAGEDAGDEFIELYNPTDHLIDISNWSIQYLSGTADSVEKIKKKNFEEESKIAPKGFFLIAREKNNKGSNGYTGQVLPDLTHRSFSLSGSSAGATVFLVNTTEKIGSIGSSTIIDSIDYALTVPVAGQSLERKAYNDGQCVSPQNAGEYLGNGCDNDDENDFESREYSHPQNTQSLPEPRPAPEIVQNFLVQYVPKDLTASFNWDEHSAHAFRLVDTNGSNPADIISSGTYAFQRKLDQVGHQYEFEIYAMDREGLASIPASASVNVPSFLDSVSFYKDPYTASQSYLVDLGWRDYPIMPVRLKHLASQQEASNNWHAILLYYDYEAPVTDDLFWINYNPSSSYKSWGLTIPYGLRFSYPNCLGFPYKTSGASLILPEGESQCSSMAGNHASYALDIHQLEDNHIILPIIPEYFSSQSYPIVSHDYITAAFYAYQPGYEPHNYGLKFLASDAQRYYFQEVIPVQQPPTAPANIDFNFNSDTSRLKIVWDRSTDPDTLDDLISYELAYIGTSLRTNERFMEILVEPSAVYEFTIYAVDDLGNKSDSTIVQYTTPEAILPYGISDIWWGNNTDGSISVVAEFETYPFMTRDVPGAMIFFLNQNPPIKLSFLDDDYRNADKIGSANTILETKYFPCDFGGAWNKQRESGALFLHNEESCPTKSNGLFMSSLLAASLASDSVGFSAKVSGVIADGVSSDYEFSLDDYITVGFYELGEQNSSGEAYFNNTVNYTGKIYFKENPVE
jgi:hypothetical protein